jgi:hypothetical protein
LKTHLHLPRNPDTERALPQAADMERAATELASDALILGEGLRRITEDLMAARDLIESDPGVEDLNDVHQGLARLEAVILTLAEAGY